MKKRIVCILIGIVPIFMVAFKIERSSSGAPGSHAGAPGEKNCATSGCHDDNILNSGTAALSIELGGITQYIAGNTYSIKVRITDANVTRFGFQLVVLANQNNTNAGSFQLTDTMRTQLVKNEHIFTDREYITYTFSGTDAIASGVSEWTVNWIAPSTNLGAVTFYAAGVSANDDMTDKGDYTYTTSKVLSN